MIRTVTSGLLAATIAVSTACAQDSQTGNTHPLPCSLRGEAQKSSGFSLAFNVATGQATLSGRFDLPQANHAVHIAPVTDDGADTQRMRLYTTPTGRIGATVERTADVSLPFAVRNNARYINVDIGGSGKTLICPVPTRASAPGPR